MQFKVKAITYIIYTMQSGVELLTVLSLLYLYHCLGKKKRKISKHERHYTIDGLLNNGSYNCEYTYTGDYKRMLSSAYALKPGSTDKVGY